MFYLSRRSGRRVVRRAICCPALVVMSLGLGAVFVSVTTAANAGVPADKAGLAAGLINTSLQLGSALGLAIFSAIATATTTSLLSEPGADQLHGAHRRLPRRAPRLLDLPPGRYRVRAAHRELPRRGLRAYHLTPKD